MGWVDLGGERGVGAWWEDGRGEGVMGKMLGWVGGRGSGVRSEDGSWEIGRVDAESEVVG